MRINSISNKKNTIINDTGIASITKSQTLSIRLLDLPFKVIEGTSRKLGAPLVQLSPKPKRKKDSHLLTSIGFYSSIDFGTATLKSSSLSDAYSSFISDRTDLMEKIGFGVDFNILKFKKWSFYSGIGVELLTDKFSWTGSYIDYREGEYIESITKYEDGRIQENLRFGTIPWEVQKRINHYDDRLLITVPLIVNYEFRRGNNRFGASAGLDLRYQNSHTSLVLDEFDVPKLYDMESGFLSPSARLSLGYGYYLDDKWSLGVDFMATQLKSNFAIDPTTSNLNYQMLGARIGVRYEGF